LSYIGRRTAALYVVAVSFKSLQLWYSENTSHRTRNLNPERGDPACPRPPARFKRRRNLSALSKRSIVSGPSLESQVFCAAFTTPGIDFDFVRNLLTFRQAGKPRPLNGADVNKDIVSAITGLDKAKTLLAVEPFDSTCRHFHLQSMPSRDHHAIPIQLVDVFGKGPAGAFQKEQRLIEQLTIVVFTAKCNYAAYPAEVWAIIQTPGSLLIIDVAGR